MHYKSIVAVICAVSAVGLCAIPCVASADSVPSGTQFLQDIVSQYNLGDLSATSVSVYYITTESKQNTHSACLWIGTDAYRVIYDSSQAIPTNKYYHATYSCSVNANFCGNAYMLAGYYSPASDQLYQEQLLTFWTNNADSYNTYASNSSKFPLNPSKGTYISGSSTVSDFVEKVVAEAPDPTESNTSGGFQLPDSWVNGGETLPDAEEPTFPTGFNPDDAFEQFEDVTYEIEDSVKSGIGFFWAVLTRVIDSLNIWSYVFFSLLFLLIIWLLKGL